MPLTFHRSIFNPLAINLKNLLGMKLCSEYDFKMKMKFALDTGRLIGGEMKET